MPRRPRSYALAILVLLAPVLAHSATVHVSPSGSNGNSCGSGQPKQTIASGISCMRGGDTLVLHAGTYTNDPIHRLPSGTSSSARTTVRTAGDGPVLLRSTTRDIDCLWCVSGNLQTVDGGGRLTMDGGAQSVYIIAGTLRDDITLRGVRITNARGQGIFTSEGKRWLVENNEIDHNGPPGSNFAHGMYFSPWDSIVQNNYLHHNACYNMQNYSSSGHPPVNNTFRGNIFTASGCGVTSPMGSNHKFLNNIFYNDGINNGGSNVGLLYAASNGRIYNNTFYCNRLLYNQGGGATTGTIVRGNIFYCPGKTLTVTLPGSVTITNNLMNVNPNFVNVGATPGNFHLMAGSPAINQSVTLTEASPDKDGVARPQPSGSAYDYGAYEFVPAGPSPLPIPFP